MPKGIYERTAQARAAIGAAMAGSQRHLIHGMTGTPTWKSWCAMRRRCKDPKATGYQYWGGRGITVCSRWMESLLNFLEDMGERPPGLTLDRVDNDGNYEPGNCRWATRKEQRMNQQTLELI